MSSRNNNPRHRRGGSSKVTIVTAVAAFVLIASLGIALWATSGTGRVGATAVVATATPPPPAPRPIATEVVASAPTPSQSALEEPTLTVGTGKGQLAPDFALDALDGEKRLSDFRGQVVLLNFWASWCGPCRMEFPELQKVYDKYKDQGFTIVAVNLGESAETASDFADQLGLGFPIMLDTNMGVARQYQAYSIPTSYFLDRQGVVQDMRIGAMQGSFVDSLVSRLLAEE